MRASSWLYPVVQIAHIVGFIVLAGGAILFDLRMLGLSSLRAGAAARVDLRALGMHLLPWSVVAALLVVPSGVLMFAVDAESLIGNRAFLLKLVLLACAAGNAIAFHLGVGRHWARWSAAEGPPPAARVHAGVSIGLWISIVSCGRMIAYV
ncbi:MAG: hypothetical protein H7125_07905 [Proteobacteria bacterium]|nr:hypothetical protein [Burkholderiales bacterium]